MNQLLEICCGSIDDAIEAQVGGADRIELCSAMFLGGLTPSLGTLQVARERLTIPIMAMLRPRSGGFCYTEAEFATMERDAETLLANGADGIVFGILDPDGNVDVTRTRRLRELAGCRQSVFHRAFDVTPDPFHALDQLIDLGISRVLTSGQRSSALEAADLIHRLIDHVAGRIEILPGGGIRLHNVEEVVARTGCRQVHMTAWKSMPDSSTRGNPALRFAASGSPPEDSFPMTDSALVRQLAEKLK